MSKRCSFEKGTNGFHLEISNILEQVVDVSCVCEVTSSLTYTLSCN